MIPNTKLCAKCSTEKSVSEFYKRSDTSGYRAHCKSCMEAERVANADKHAKRAADWRAADPERARASVRACYARHKDDRRQSDLVRNSTPERKTALDSYRRKRAPKARINQREWRRQNPDYCRDYLKAYARANPDKWRVYRNKRRALKRNAEGSHTAADLAEIRAAQGDKCAACECELNGCGHLDHIQSFSPRFTGVVGSNDRSNLQYLCKSCNSSKSDRDFTEFLLAR
jgi:hypothetical protein